MIMKSMESRLNKVTPSALSLDALPGAVALDDAVLDSVVGGLLPLLILGAVLLAGCAHCGPYVKKDPPPGGGR